MGFEPNWRHCLEDRPCYERSRRPTIEVGVPGPGGDIAAGEGAVWVRAAKVLLSVIDPKTNKVKMRFGPAQGSGAVRAGDGKVWVSAHDVNKIWSINPATEALALLRIPGMPHYNTGWRSRCVHLRKRSGRQQRTTRRLDTESPSVRSSRSFSKATENELSCTFTAVPSRPSVTGQPICERTGPASPRHMDKRLMNSPASRYCALVLRFEHGDWDGGIDDLIATMMLGRHIGRGKIWHNVHFGCMLEAMATGTAAFYLPRMPETARQRLTRDLGLLPPPTSMREVVLHYEENAFDWAIDNFERAEKEGRLLELVASISGKENAKKALELCTTPTG